MQFRINKFTSQPQCITPKNVYRLLVNVYCLLKHRASLAKRSTLIVQRLLVNVYCLLKHRASLAKRSSLIANHSPLTSHL